MDGESFHFPELNHAERRDYIKYHAGILVTIPILWTRKQLVLLPPPHFSKNS